MNIKLIAVGKIKEKYIKEGVEEFLKRLRGYTSVEVVEIPSVEIKDENLTSKSLDEEAENILSNIKDSSFVITMEIQGKQFSSEEFSDKIKEIINDGVSELVFIIGSSCGLSKKVSDRANLKLSLSKMTYLHEFARLILVEQIYRAFKIMRGEKYHK